MSSFMSTGASTSGAELAERLAYQLGGLAGAIFFCFIVSIIAGRRDTGLRTDFLFSLFILLFVSFLEHSLT
jgi:hypothetical protein